MSRLHVECDDSTAINGFTLPVKQNNPSDPCLILLLTQPEKQNIFKPPLTSNKKKTTKHKNKKKNIKIIDLTQNTEFSSVSKYVFFNTDEKLSFFAFLENYMTIRYTRSLGLSVSF